MTTKTVNGQNVGNSKGIASITQNGTGDYTLTFQDSYVKLLAFSGAFDETSNSGIAPLAPVLWIKSESVGSPAGAGTLNFITGGYAAGAATNPAANEILKLEIHLSNSTAY